MTHLNDCSALLCDRKEDMTAIALDVWERGTKVVWKATKATYCRSYFNFFITHTTPIESSFR